MPTDIPPSPGFQGNRARNEHKDGFPQRRGRGYVNPLPTYLHDKLFHGRRPASPCRLDAGTGRNAEKLDATRGPRPKVTIANPKGNGASLAMNDYEWGESWLCEGKATFRASRLQRRSRWPTHGEKALGFTLLRKHQELRRKETQVNQATPGPAQKGFRRALHPVC